MSDPVIRDLGRPGDLGWVVMAHGELYAEEYGWGGRFEALVARIVADYATVDESPDARRQSAWIAEWDGRRIGCVFCTAADDTTAQLRVLLVDPSVRGHRLGAALVDRCIGFARSAGYARMRLWTNDPLTAARSIYLSRGFRLVEQRPHRGFGVGLTGQTYELALD